MNTSCHCSTYSQVDNWQFRGSERKNENLKKFRANVCERGENFSANHTKNATTTTWADFRFFSRDIFPSFFTHASSYGSLFGAIARQMLHERQVKCTRIKLLLPATSHNACNNCSITQFLEFQWEVEEFQPNHSQNKNTLSHCTFGASIDFLAIFKPCWPRSNV